MAAVEETFPINPHAKLDYQARLKNWLGDNELLDSIDNVDSHSKITIGQDSALSAVTDSAINSSDLTIDGETDPSGTVITIWADPDENNVSDRGVYTATINFTTDQGRQDRACFHFFIVKCRYACK